MFPTTDTYVADWKELSLGYAGWDTPPFEADLDPAELAAVYAAAMPSGKEVQFTPQCSAKLSQKPWLSDSCFAI